ncbi:Nucleoside diphosphate-linked moiety X motif 19, mitochondrial-like Protein [Tribolium castaneum]|uniref:Nucleoside diphosphate-linked moiety X motif 19, mitochondrial-like Protein n=2 Tax=Tribolium castaneum TaxID=7070 RepID=D6W6P0_TRICA|nr:Nucleoside diphosphate-linked moiety X motif 19, mitochondrial-like Protein [Tribolium castaneum]
MWRESASLILAAKSVFGAPNPFNYKILCLKRSSKSGFMPNTYVFPGGNVSPSDSNLEWLKLYENFGFCKQSFDDLRAVENIPNVLEHDEKNRLPKYLSFRICAIRETFEECGILLARPKINADTASNWASFIGGKELVSWQHKVHDDSEQFFKMCSHFELCPDVWALKNWSHWVTPPSYLTSKFNTIFFLTTLHQMPTVHKDEREIQDLMWTTPEQCIEMNNQQKVLLPVPQFYEMSRLKTVPDVEALSDFATKRARAGFETYWPFRVKTNEGMYTILPGDDLYQKNDENNTAIPQVEQLPEARTKNRILHKSKYSNVVQIENFRPKCNHIAPVGAHLFNKGY